MYKNHVIKVSDVGSLVLMSFDKCMGGKMMVPGEVTNWVECCPQDQDSISLTDSVFTFYLNYIEDMYLNDDKM